MHLVQAYNWPHVLTGPNWWAVDGIADYARYTEGVDNEGAGWSLPPFKKSHMFTNSYRVAARFFSWIEKNVKKGFVKAFDSALRTGNDDGFIRRATGKSVDELWQQYAANPDL